MNIKCDTEIEVDSMSSVAEKPGTSKSSQLKKKKRHTNSQSSLTFRKASKRYKMDSEHSGMIIFFYLEISLNMLNQD